ncbi:MAG: helix-turn-helix domain-containing protein [Clostridia bacterium]|nr:helix-turn-helix domain-containing protein [Clostridia bacterium]
MKETTSFDKVDYETAQIQYDSWAAKKCETLDEFLLRKRKIELINLVRKVLENELNENDKELVRLHWYEGKSVTEAANILSCSKSSVSKRLEKINSIVYDKLKYAIEYRFGADNSQNMAVIIKSKDALACCAKPESTSQRIKSLRLSQGMSLEDVSDMTNISKKCLERIENAEKDATSNELAKIATAFRTSTDYIIFGKKERKCCQ